MHYKAVKATVSIGRSSHFQACTEQLCSVFSLSPVAKPKRKLRSTVSNTLNQKWLRLSLACSLSDYCTIVAMSQIPIDLTHRPFSSMFNTKWTGVVAVFSNFSPAYTE